jgi:hypothetical protein
MVDPTTYPAPNVSPKRSRLLLAAGVLLASACSSGPPSAAPSALVESASAEPTSPPATGLPAGCNDIDMRVPSTGEALDLEGTWFVDPADGIPATWWTQPFGDCIWGTGIYDEIPEGFTAEAASVQTMQGTINNDFTIDSTVVLLGLHPEFVTPDLFAEVHWRIEFDDAGSVTLVEDREPGVAGPRCPDPVGYCPAPLVLRPRD